jgi:uncharacterized protein
MSMHAGPVRRSRAADGVLGALIWFYRAATVNRRPACRFVPSCSEYAIEAVHRHGARRAVPLIAKRLVRCRPGGPFGLDPVPEKLPSRAGRLQRGGTA